MADKPPRLSYYPGCSLEATARNYDRSFRQVCRALNAELLEVPEWICCGSSAGLKTSRLLSLSLAAQNLTLLERQEPEEVVVPCPFCFRRLLSAQQEIAQDQAIRESVQKTLETPLKRTLRIRNILDFFLDAVGMEAIAARVVKRLNGLKVLPYYGCYLVKPARVTRFDDPENPTSLDRILSVLGAEVLDWDFKTECCGASLSLSKTEKVLELSGRVLREACWKGAEVLVVACQLCQSNLDMRQEKIFDSEKNKHPLPVLYISQLMGLAFGLPAGDLGFKSHFVDPGPVLGEKGLLS